MNNQSEQIFAYGLAAGLLPVLLAFGAFFLGIVVRRTVYGGKGMSRCQEFLAAIPTSFIIVPVFLPSYWLAFSNVGTESIVGMVSFLATTGLIMEQGMVIPEFFRARLQVLTEKAKAATVPPAPPNGLQ